MGIEKLNKAAEAAGLAMAPADDDLIVKETPRAAEAWRYSSPRAKSKLAERTAATSSVWTYFTGKATA